MNFLKGHKQNEVPDSTIVLNMRLDYESLLKTARSEGRQSPRVPTSLRQRLDECELDATVSPSPSLFSRKRHMDGVLDEAAAKRRQSQVELITANCKISRLEAKICDLEVTINDNKIKHDREIEEIKAQNETDKKKREDMHVELALTLQNEIKVKQELNELKKKYDVESKVWSSKYKKLDEELMEVKNRYDEETNQLTEEVLALENENQNLQLEVENLRSDLECCDEKIAQFNDKAGEFERISLKEVDWEHEKDAFAMKIKELEDELKKHEEEIELTKILRKQVASMPQLEVENRRFKEENRVLRSHEENVLLLREQLETSRQTIERLENQNVRFQRLTMENEYLKTQNLEWRNISLAGRAGEPRSAQEVAKVVAGMQQENLLNMEKIGDLNSRFRLLEKANESLQEELKAVRLKCQRQEVSFKQNSEHIRHLQRKLSLVSKERDFTRQLLDSYEKDTTMNVSQSVNSEKNSKMQTIVEEYRLTVEKLEAELEASREHLVHLGFQSKDELDKSRSESSSELKSLKIRIAELESQVAELDEAKKALELKVEYEMIKGVVNPLKTRAVHLRSNPVSWMAEDKANEVQSLIKENAVLKERVKILEEEGAKAQDVTLRVAARLEEVTPEQVIEDLKSQLVAADIQKSRVKETFKKFSSEIREVTCKLLGYKMEQPCSNQYKLSSIYAQSPQDYLLFTRAEDGGIQLLETPFSTFLSDKISLYLHTHHSIPAFLSSLTLDLSIDDCSLVMES